MAAAVHSRSSAKSRSAIVRMALLEKLQAKYGQIGVAAAHWQNVAASFLPTEKGFSFCQISNPSHPAGCLWIVFN
jgi:hypothetical protein